MATTNHKTVSIAYCGGCNAGYDRVAFIQQVLARAQQAGAHLVMVDTAHESDIAIVLAGCQALCVADRPDLGGRAKVRHVVGPDMLDAIRMPLEEVGDCLVQELLA